MRTTLFIAALLIIVHAARAADQFITLSYPKGLQAVTVPVESATIRTARDLAALFGSPFVSRTNNGRFETYVTGSRDFLLAGNKGYILHNRASRMISWTGRPWSAGQLKVNLGSGFEIIANPRRSEGPMLWNFYEEARLRFLGHLLFDDHGRPLWSPSRMHGFDTFGQDAFEQNIFMPNLAYALIRVSSPQTLILPNTNQRPRASLDSAPLSATTGTMIPIASLRSHDNDDDPANLVYEWSLSSAGGTTTAHGAVTFILSLLSGRYSLTLTVSDGLAEHRATGSSIDVIPRTTSTREEILYGLRWQPISNALGVDAPTLSQDIARSFTNTTDNQPAISITADHAVSSTDLAVEAQPSAALRTLSLAPMRNYWSGAVMETSATTIAVDSTEVVTQPELYDLLLESRVDSADGSRVFQFFAGTQRIGNPTKMSKDGRVATFKRSIATKLSRLRPTRIVPVSLANRVDARWGYAVIPVNPSLPLGSRTAVLLLPGWNPKAEVCLEGAPAHQRLLTWSPLFGTDTDHRYWWPGLAENISDLERSYAFYRCQYPTIRAPSEIARSLAREVERVIFRDNPQASFILIGYSIGGLVARWLRNEYVGETRLGERTRWIITIATPHHGTELATQLPGMFTNNGSVLWQLERMYWPLLNLGCIPPSPGMAALRFDGLVPFNTRGDLMFIPPARRNPELENFNTNTDAYRNVPNVIYLAGGTVESRLGDDFYEQARRSLYRVSSEQQAFPWLGYSDGVVGTESSIPRDMGGDAKGSWDRHIGRMPDGSMDRVAYFDGFDHSMMATHVEPIAAIHNFLSEVATKNRPPVSESALVILTTPWKEVQSPPYPQARIRLGPSTVSDPDRDILSHHWRVELTDPGQRVELDGIAQAEPVLVVNTTPGNILIKHAIRDNRGGIAWQIVSVAVGDPHNTCWENSIGYPSDELPHLEPVQNGSRIKPWPTSCILQEGGGYRAWIDPFNPSTELKGWSEESVRLFVQTVENR